MNITVRVCDATFGKPATEVAVRLDHLGSGWEERARGTTDGSGLLQNWLPEGLTPGIYRLECNLDSYFVSLGIVPAFPVSTVIFRTTKSEQFCQIFLVISPYSNFAFCID